MHPRRSAGRFLVTTLASFVVASCDGVPGIEREEEPGIDLLDAITRPGNGAVHLVRLVQRAGQYAFEPDEIKLSPGEVVRFVMVGSQPESVAFDPAGASPEAAEFIRSNGLHRGVLLTELGQAYDVSFRGAPPGVYPFLSLPHAVQGMRGVVVVGD